MNNNTENSQGKRWYMLSKQELVLVVVTMFWGATFLVVQTAVKYSGPLFFVGFRFGMAGLFAIIVFRKQLAKLTRYELMAGLSIGLVLCLAYSLQTAGLQTIESSKSAFITALYVPMVPVLQWVILRQSPPLMRWLGIVLAFIGLILITAPKDFMGAGLAQMFSFGEGEWLTLGGALGMAMEIILISKFAGKVKAGAITAVQLLSASIFSFIAMPVMGEGIPDFNWLVVIFAVGMGVLSVNIQFAMNWAQRTVSATRATIIYAGEPIWAGIVGRIAGERLPLLAFAGGALIILGIIVSELRPSKWAKRIKNKD